VFSLSRKLKLNLNSRLVVIFVLRLSKPLGKNTNRNRSAKVSHALCWHVRLMSVPLTLKQLLFLWLV